MLGLNRSAETKPRTWTRGVSFWGTCCGAIAILMLTTGCPRCSDNASCDDGDFCNGAETCGEPSGGFDDGCRDGTPPCAEAQICNEEADRCDDCDSNDDCDDGNFCSGTETCTDGQCVASGNPCSGATPVCNEAADRCDECDSNDDCDDGLFCNGAETCADGSCVAGVNPCGAGTICIEASDSCRPTCNIAADCEDDGLFCTITTCTEGACINTARNCDDGLFCNGVEACNEATDSCDSPGNPCPQGTVCNETTDSCETGVACNIDADCDNGVFCDGSETCNQDGVCVMGTAPCNPESEDCEEGDNAAVCVPRQGPELLFTLNLDNLTGTTAADTFSAPLAFNAGTGNLIPTLQSGDIANGLAGPDVLNAAYNNTTNANQTITPTLNGIETWNLTDFGGANTTTVSALNSTGVQTVNSVSSTATLRVQDLGSLVNLGITNSNQGANIAFLTAATSGNMDTMSLALSNVTGGTVTLTSGTTNGLETLAVSSGGAAANTLTEVAQNTGNTLSRVNISGAQSLRITNALPATVATVDASGSTGGVNVDISGNAGIVTVTGGDGNDTFALGANYATTDTVNGGGGTLNTLSITTAVAAPTTNQTNVTNIQGLTISDAHTTATVASRFGSINTINLPLGSNGGSLTVASGTAINLGARGANNDSAGALTVTVSGTANNDVVNLNVNDSDMTGAMVFNGVEIANLASNVDLDGSAADGDVNNFGAAFTLPDVSGSTLNITGTEDVSFTGAVTARVINASTFAHRVLMTLNASGATTTSTVATGGASITGGSGNDRLVGSTGGDSITSGTGNNEVQPGRGIDTVTFNLDGRNILDLEDLAVAQLVSANRVTVSGFDANGTPFTANAGSIDAIRFGNVASQASLADGAVASEFQAVTTPGNVTSGAGVAIVELAFEFSPGVDLGAGGANELSGTTLLSACGALSGTTACTFTTTANDDDIVIIAYQTSGGVTSAYIYHGNGAGGNTALVAAEINLVAVISGNVTVGGFDVSQFVD